MKQILSKEQDRLLLKVVDEAFSLVNNLPKSGQNIIYIPSYYQLDYARLFDIVMAIALKLRGAQITPILTDPFFCKEFYYGGEYAVNDSIGFDHHDTESCIWKEILRTDTVYIFENENETSRGKAVSMVSSLDYHNYLELSYKGYDVGRQAANLVANFNNMPAIENDVIILSQVKLHAEFIIRLIDSYERVFNSIKPETIFSNTPFYYKWGAAQKVAKTLNIPFYGFALGDRKNSWIFTSDSTVLHDVSAAWPSFLESMSSDKVLRFIETVAERKLNGETEHHFYYHKPKQKSPDHQKYYQWRDSKKPLAILPVNLLFDAVAYQSANCFGNLPELVFDTIEYFNNKPEYQLIDKAHPAETMFYQMNKPEFSKYCLANLLSRCNIKLNDNVYFLDYNSTIPLSDLVEDISLGLVYSSTSAIEMAMNGKPVISVSKTHYSEKGFVYEPQTKSEYFEYIEDFLTKEISTNQELQRN